MRQILALVIAITLGSLSCWSGGGAKVDLSTPEGAMRSYYAAFLTSRFESQQQTLDSSIQGPGRERYDAVAPLLQDYQILRIREGKDRIGEAYPLPEDAVDVLVKEFYVDRTESTTSFVLRKSAGRWLIVDFVTENEAEFPPDESALEEQAKQMLDSSDRR